MLIPGDLIATARTAAGLSQDDLGRALEVSRSAVAQWERRGVGNVQGFALVGLLVARGQLSAAGVLLAELDRSELDRAG